ncbi:hypothetical protein GCM10011492_16970 [Flexivirga endophytica]|uniref:DUF8017 domain-containing protein n=1 Tax=Flexivirga endophytica TaxID=1849103 RepID=A0A916T125_9MICO|nr:hypothetical protein [Flexivirga endophytica]GGB27246.1 hypothetical protein GCM10011492_16970 [Flexivirga endophytica]GHB55739.1 hypothetical protein GCM10008112_26280 [Flexivirga endophytica]
MSDQGDGRPPEGAGDRQGQTGDQWAGQQRWSGRQQPWATAGQDAQPPSWSTGQPSTQETGPNVGPTMNNPQSSYYDRFSAASGEGITGPQRSGGSGGGRGKVLIGLAAALVLIVAAVAIFAFTRGDDSPKQATGSSSTQALQPVKATTWVNPTLGVGARPVKDGWQTQSSVKLGGQYDVPKEKDWKVESNSYVIYYPGKKENEIITAAGGISQYKVGFCKADKEEPAAWVGVRDIKKSDPEQVGASEAQKLAKGIGTSLKGGKDVKPGKVSAAKKVKVDQGTIPAVQYTTTAQAGDPNSCNKGKKYEVRTVNFKTPERAYQLVVVRLLGVADTLPTSRVDEIISTFRPDN